jgi:diguanylate cyclase (GGDEF)-like protein
MNDGQLRQLYPLIPLGMCVLDEGLHILKANVHFEETFGAPGKRIFPEFVCECIGEQDVKARILQGRDSGTPNQIRCTLRNQGEAQFDVTYSFDLASRVFYVVIGPPQATRDSGINDPLTGLANRELFLDRAEQLIFRARREEIKVAFLFMDLNGFKPINDTHGHKAGDMVLKSVAERIVASTRKVDTVARFGGDEFVVALSDIRQGVHAILSTKRIFSRIEEPIDIGLQQRVRISASVGISLYPDDDESILGLIRKADEAMYKAKRGGGGYCFYDMSTACR